VTPQENLPGICCPHPLEAHHAHVISEKAPGFTWEVDTCYICGCKRNERNRKPTGEGDE
jgi:hypothetical protein